MLHPGANVRRKAPQCDPVDLPVVAFQSGRSTIQKDMFYGARSDNLLPRLSVLDAVQVLFSTLRVDRRSSFVKRHINTDEGEVGTAVGLVQWVPLPTALSRRLAYTYPHGLPALSTACW